MEGICGVFQSTLMAPWISGVGTLVASVTALFIYWKNRRNQERDLATRRAILHEMLIQNLWPAIDQILAMKSVAEKNDLSGLGFAGWAMVVRPKWSTRLVALQDQLVSVGQARDKPIAAFIESLQVLDLQIEMSMAAFKRIGDEKEGSVKNFLQDLANHEASGVKELVLEAAQKAAEAKALRQTGSD